MELSSSEMDQSELFHDTYQELWQIEQATQTHITNEPKNEVILSTAKNDSMLFQIQIENNEKESNSKQKLQIDKTNQEM